MILKAIGVGLIASFVGTLVVFIGGGILVMDFSPSAFFWIFSVIVIPTCVASVVIGWLAGKIKPSTRNLWLTALVVAFLTILFGGPLGAIGTESWQRGIAHVNVWGYIAWSPIYALSLLPVTVPISFGVVKMLWSPDSKPIAVAE